MNIKKSLITCKSIKNDKINGLDEFNWIINGWILINIKKKSLITCQRCNELLTTQIKTTTTHVDFLFN